MASQKGLDFKHKEVINITDGKRLGYVQDVALSSKWSFLIISLPANDKAAVPNPLEIWNLHWYCLNGSDNLFIDLICVNAIVKTSLGDFYD